MKPLRMAGLVLAALALACSRSAPPFVIPDLEDLEYLYVTQLEGTTKVWQHEIRDPKRIKPILAHFREHNSGYRQPTDLSRMVASDSRVQDHAISFSTGEGVPLIIWIGPDWLGGFDQVYEEDGRSSISRYRPLDASEREALLSLIRETDPMGRVVISNGEYL